MKDYEVKIVDGSRKFTAKERIALKDLGDAIQLDEVANEPIIITPVDYAVLEVHNEKSDNHDYTKFIIIDADGQKYVTGSESFWRSFTDIMDEVSDAEEELKPGEWAIKVYKLESKNYKGKQFITCTIV